MTTRADHAEDASHASICDYCGGFIDHEGQLCPARDTGVCRP
jgi:hypothetical protein